MQIDFLEEKHVKKVPNVRKFCRIREMRTLRGLQAFTRISSSNKCADITRANTV